MLLGELLNTLAGKSGIAQDDADLKALLSNPTISGYEIPDTIVSKLQGNLLTIEAAKNNSVVRNHITAQVYNGIDSELNNAYSDMGIDDTVKADLLNEKSTSKRVSKSLKVIADLEKAKAGASKGEKGELQKEIDRLNGLEKTNRENYEKKLADKEVEKQDFIVDYELSTILGSYKYALPEEMPQSVKIQTAKLLLKEEMKEKDGKAVWTPEGAKLVRASTGSDYFDDKNNKIDLKGFADIVVAKNKLLQTKAADEGGNGTPAATIITGQKKGDSRTMASAINAAMADLK